MLSNTLIYFSFIPEWRQNTVGQDWFYKRYLITRINVSNSTLHAHTDIQFTVYHFNLFSNIEVEEDWPKINSVHPYVWYCHDYISYSLTSKLIIDTHESNIHRYLDHLYLSIWPIYNYPKHYTINNIPNVMLCYRFYNTLFLVYRSHCGFPHRRKIPVPSLSGSLPDHYWRIRISSSTKWTNCYVANKHVNVIW